MDQVGDVAFYGAVSISVFIMLVALGRAGAVLTCNSHWYGVLPKECVLGRFIGGLHVLVIVTGTMLCLSFGTGMLLQRLSDIVCMVMHSTGQF
jgi:hypothetical protein